MLSEQKLQHYNGMFNGNYAGEWDTQTYLPKGMREDLPELVKLAVLGLQYLNLSKIAKNGGLV